LRVSAAGSRTRGKRRAAIELAHRGCGAAGGAAYALLPEKIRRQPWSGPQETGR
jgi:hypothetical protein